MERYICIHGHFYQPPRENPWLEEIEVQDSAYPFHDWNERITAECYATNGVSRILDGKNRITQIVNNYARISFNFGPTLLSWMEQKAPSAYRSILAADRESQQYFSGHGSALAQVYNHMIMPLANRRDKCTQVIWGLRDFESRFERKAEGIWLAETAVDLETLEILVDHGIKFTILSPYQGRRVRPKNGATTAEDENSWIDVTGGRIDPTMAYEQRLPSGRTIALFFYDGPVSQAVAFEQLLSSGERLAHRLTGAFSDERSWPQMVHIATDGETYGHHHRFGEMALGYALHYIETNNLAKITIYGEYLEKHPPIYEADILENTSWSCFHGVERWRGNCGCNSGGHGDWNQEWRAPLRAALDWLRDTLAPLFERQGAELFKDPWAARNDYIVVILDRSAESVSRFLEEHATHTLTIQEKVTALKLLELQRYAMLMYTSCGWFFDELSGIETVQVIQYAGRVIQLAEELFDTQVEAAFLDLVEQAKSNILDYQDGRQIYERFVRPSVTDLHKVAAHFAVSSLFAPYSEEDTRIYSYRIDHQEMQIIEAGRPKLAIGKTQVTSDITGESALLTFGVLHFGDHNLTGGVREFQSEAAFQDMVDEVTAAFERADLPEVIRLLDKHFLDLTYSLKSLFRDEQRKILNLILDSTLEQAEAVYRQLYEQNVPLMRFLSDLGTPPIKAFRTAAEFALNSHLRRALEEEELDFERIRILLEEARVVKVVLDAEMLGYTIQHTLEQKMERFFEEPADLDLLQGLEAAVNLARTLPFEVNLWQTQNIYYGMLQTFYPTFLKKAERGNEDAQIWISHFSALGDKLRVRVT
jgi:alpha-amylase/alpha-mannosidase (GH57 family)